MYKRKEKINSHEAIIVKLILDFKNGSIERKLYQLLNLTTDVQFSFKMVLSSQVSGGVMGSQH